MTTKGGGGKGTFSIYCYYFTPIVFQNTNFRFQFSTKLEMLVVEAVSLQEGAVKTYNNILTEICLFLNPFPSFLKQDGHCDLKSKKIVK